MCDFDDFFDPELADFALWGGVIGFIEEEFEEEDSLNQLLENIDPEDLP